MNIKISAVKKIREQFNLTHIVIFGIDENNYYHVATHGKTRIHAQEAAKAGNNLKSILNFPVKDCKSNPLERICENCDYWKRQHHPGYPIDKYGKCYYDTNPISRADCDRACHNFEPNC